MSSSQKLCVPEKEHPMLLQVICCCLSLSGSRQQRELFNLQSRKKLCVTRCREREWAKFSHFLPFSGTIPGRHQDESKLCLTNTLVLFSLHGKLARTSDIVSSDQRQYFFLNISLFLPPSLPPRQDVHCCCSLVYPIRVVRLLQSIWVFILYFVKGIGTCLCACLHVCKYRVCVFTVPLSACGMCRSLHGCMHLIWLCICVCVCLQVCTWEHSKK